MFHARKLISDAMPLKVHKSTLNKLLELTYGTVCTPLRYKCLALGDIIKYNFFDIIFILATYSYISFYFPINVIRLCDRKIIPLLIVGFHKHRYILISNNESFYRKLYHRLIYYFCANVISSLNIIHKIKYDANTSKYIQQLTFCNCHGNCNTPLQLSRTQR